jgi:hypothetical protein
MIDTCHRCMIDTRQYQTLKGKINQQEWFWTSGLAHATLRSASHPAWLNQSMPPFVAPKDGPSDRKNRLKCTCQKSKPRWDGRPGIAAIISKVHSKMNVCGVNFPSELKCFRFYCKNFHQIAKVVALERQSWFESRPGWKNLFRDKVD